MLPDLTGTTIVFDLDGTLVDTAPDLTSATNHALAMAGAAPVSVEELHPFIGRGSKAMIEAGLGFRGVSVSEDDSARLHKAFLEFYADNVAVDSRPFEGVGELLDQLVGAGARLAVCTNKYEALSRLLLVELELAGKFAAIAGRDTFSVCKPDPAHLTGTIALAGGRADRAVMVGDSEIDIATAVAAAIPSIGVTFGYTSRPVREFGPNAVIDHYREFPAALVRVLG
ncbi:MAG: HAD family hydrolase [Hyphomicrobiaceae bacterium]